MDRLIPSWQPDNKFAITQQRIAVVAFDLATIHSLAQLPSECLNSEEKERASRFYFEKDRTQFSAARVGLRCLLASLLNIAPANLRLKATDHGKLYLPNHPSLSFNVTHSGQMVLYAFSAEGQLGIDIENTQRDVEVLELAERFFSVPEFDELSLLQGAALKSAFFRVWTRKEAFIKAEGTGLSFPLQDFIVPIGSRDGIFPVGFTKQKYQSCAWWAETFIPKPDYFASVSANFKWSGLDYFKLDKLLILAT